MENCVVKVTLHGPASPLLLELELEVELPENDPLCDEL
jgi:hypothetical protein